MTAPPEVHHDELRLVPGVYCAGGDGLLRLASWRRHLLLGPDLGWKRRLLTTLADGGHPGPELVALAGAGATPAEVEQLLARLLAGGWLISTVRDSGRPLYTVAPLGPLPPPPDRPADGLVLSRFTVVRREERLVVESPLATARLEAHDPRVAALVGGLAGPQPPDPAATSLPAAAATRLLADLQRTGLAVAGSGEEDSQQRLLQWKPHELWFHHRSRRAARSAAGERFGRTKWASGRFPPLPARRDPYPGPVTNLVRPDLAALRSGDPPLTAVLEDRRSTRIHDDTDPITVEQLGTLLYRCARVRGSIEVQGVEYVSRPYPAGGSAYELELYPVVRLAAGLDAGMYHYEAHEHRLRLVRGPGAEARRLLKAAAMSTLEDVEPQVLIVISARFGRVMWTYEQMAYSLILKHVGVLYQTMYLVATAMGLAACGLGSGDATAFNEATGADYPTESAVGEFSVGSLPPDGGQPGGPDGSTATP